MAIETGIKWTDSTSNPWWGCTKVEGAPACLDCYAEDVDKRGTAKDQPLHWGRGAPRRRVSEKARNEPYRWQRNAERFLAENGRRQRVFTLSMGDLFDNEVDPQWRSDHMGVMEDCDRLEWQICTKRVSQIPKMIPAGWHPHTTTLPIVSYSDGVGSVPGLTEHRWPQHIGVLITVVTQKEADRDIPRLREMKRRFGIPWVGISYEPAQEEVDFREWLNVIPVMTTSVSARDGEKVGPTTFHWEPSYRIDDPGRTPIKPDLDWIIFGGKSGSKWNDGPFNLNWARQTRDQCAAAGTSFFMKQIAAFRPTDAMIPPDLMVREWPRGH